MHVVFLASDKPRERILAEAFTEGCKVNGDTVETHRLQPGAPIHSEADVVCMVGVKSRDVFRAYARAGTHIVMLDKGYSRHSVASSIRAWEYWRLSVDAHHPTHYLGRVQRPSDRFDSLGLRVKPWREQGDHIVFAGSSAKYHAFYDLPEPTKYAEKILKRLASATGRRIVYRPKPSWKDAEPVSGSDYSDGGSIAEAVWGAHALVTHGSNACFESVLAGVPCIVLGEAVAKPISSTDLADIESPRLASEDERRQWLANLAYAQWTQGEMLSGEAWKNIRPEIYG